jgi:glucose-1-phosphate cytidylyltransferase
MKAVILAGGLGTRISEETATRPKPMIEVGGKPILWHILKTYSYHGINDFVICCGYKGYVIKEYFANYFLHMSDVTFDMSKNSMEVHQRNAEPWRVTLVDTGENTMTGGRLKRVADYVKNEEAFCFTYGDGVSDVNITELVAFHKAQGVKATLTATIPPGRFGALDLNGSKVNRFFEKPKGSLCSPLRLLITLVMILQPGRGNRLSAWHKKVIWLLISITAFGNRWILYETKFILKTCGKLAKPLGRSGREPCFLERQACSLNWSYWFQR